jgi:hypothetical protein
MAIIQSKDRPWAVRFTSVIYGNSETRYFKTRQDAETYRDKIAAHRLIIIERANTAITLTEEPA